MAQVETTISKVEQEVGSDWFTIRTTDPEMKVTTRYQERATEALGLKGKRVVLDYDETEKTSNGRTYKNRYYNSAKESETAAAPQFDQAPRTTRSPLPPEERWSISLGIGIKVAAQLLPYFPEEKRTFELGREIALGWATFHYFEPIPARPEGVRVLGGGPGAYDDPGSQTPPPTDDDIPY